MKRLACIGLLTVLTIPPALAQPADPRRAEAAERFDRGVARFERGDNAGALAELQRVHELFPQRQVLFNIGLVYEAMNRPVEATKTFRLVLQASGPLPPASVEQARRKLAEQSRRVGFLAITTSVPAQIEVNAIAVGSTPLLDPLPVAAGMVVVSAACPGYLPARRELVVPGERTVPLALELLPTERRMAHLQVTTSLPDAEIFVDGVLAGRTPLTGWLTVLPGTRVIELRRRGYRPLRREVTLNDGAQGAVELRHEEAPPTDWQGRLVLAASEPDVEVSINGLARGPYRGPLVLPPGKHHLQITLAGFVPSQRLVTVPAQGEAAVAITLLPTPETRLAYKTDALAKRRWGLIASVGGTVVAGGATTLLLLNRGPLADARAEQARAYHVLEKGQPCYVDQDDEKRRACLADFDAADDRLNGHRLRRNLGYVALGVGLASAAVGATLLLTGDDPHRYDGDSRQPLGLSIWLPPGGGGLGLGGRF